MSPKEILELLRLCGWSQAEFARRLESAESAVSRWISGDSPPAGPARILMRHWLNEARAGRFPPPATQNGDGKKNGKPRKDMANAS